MATERVKVFWKGEFVGVIDDARLDNYHYYGKWTPNDPTVTELWERMVEDENSNEPITVWVGKDHPSVPYRVAVISDKQIELTFSSG